MIKLTGCLIIALGSTMVLFAQDKALEEEKEVIIIERTVDEEGNEISRKVTRKKGGIDESELHEWEDKGSDGSERRYFNDKFFEDFGSFFGGQTSKPTLGLRMIFEEGRAEVSEVVPNSGAAEADIRPGDLIVSINGAQIATFEDVQDVLSGKNEGDEVRVRIFRDGGEIEKFVALKVNNFGPFSFNMPEGGEFFFDFGEGGDFDMDSLLRKLEGRDWSNQFRRFFDELPNGDLFGTGEEDGTTEFIERPKLGVFIEENTAGVLVTDVIKGSAADQAGLRQGDIIVRIDDQDIEVFDDVVKIIEQKRKGDTVTIQFKRNKKKEKVSVILS